MGWGCWLAWCAWCERARGWERGRGGAGLHRREFYSSDRLVLGHSKVGAERIEAHVERARVAVLVDGPLAASAGQGHSAAAARRSWRTRGVGAPHNLVVSAWPVPTYFACRCSSCECTEYRSWLVIAGGQGACDGARHVLEIV